MIDRRLKFRRSIFLLFENSLLCPYAEACPRMSVGYAEVSSAYRTTLLGLVLEWGETSARAVRLTFLITESLYRRFFNQNLQLINN